MEARLAPWLRSQLTHERSAAGLVQTGIAVLTTASFFANVGRRISPGPDSERFVPAWIARELPGFRPPPTPKSDCLWFDDESAQVWAGKFESVFARLPERVGLSKSDLERSPARFPRLLIRAIAKKSPDVLKGYTAPLARAEVARALCYVTSHAKGAPEEEMKLLLCATPYELMSASYRALRAQAKEERIGCGDVQALLLLALSADALFEMQSCSLCFRWAVPPYTLCAEHGLSGTMSGTRSQRQARYEAGRRVVKTYAQSLGAGPRGFNSLEFHTRAFVVARRLWQSSLPDETRTIASLFRQLEQLPHVREKIGMTPDGDRPRPSQLIELLRTRLDPLEFHPGAWSCKLVTAEKWFAAAQTATPGVRGYGKRTRHRVLDALLSFDAKHPSSQADLAGRAGVTPSAVAHWKRNRADEPITRELIERIEEEKQPLREERRRLRRVHAVWTQLTKHQ